MPEATLTAVPFKPSSPLTGSEMALYRGVNMRLRGNQVLFYECYQGSKNLNEPIPVSALTGTIAFTAGSAAVSGSGTSFLDELHLGQMIMASNEILVVKTLNTQTSFTASRVALTTDTGVTAYRLPVLFPLDVKRGAMLRGNALHYDKGTILAVGQGVLYVNGAVLAGDSLTATRSAQVALYSSTGLNYDVQPIGFSAVPQIANTDVTVIGSGGTKNMSLGYYSFRVAYYSSYTEGFGNPTDVLLSGGTAGYQITVANSTIEIDFTADVATRPSNSTGYIIYATAFGVNSDASAVSAIQGAWYELVRVPYTSLTSQAYTFDYVDSDLSATVASFDNDEPPDAEFFSTLDQYPVLVSTNGPGVNSTGRTTSTSPGPLLAPIKANNFDAYPAGSRVPTEKGETILGAVSSAGRMFVLTSNTLQVVSATGLPDAPIVCRTLWKRGFSNPYACTFIDDTIYGFSGTSVFRSIATGDAGSESQDFASDVEDQMATWNAGYVYLAYDPLNAELCVFSSAVSQNENGFYETEVYPYSLRKYGWQPKVVLTNPYMDMVVSGVATVAGNLEFLAGGRLAVTTVASAGTGAINGNYSYRGMSNGKPYFNIVGQPDSTTNYCIKFTTRWVITNSGGTSQYQSSVADTAAPWDASGWAATGGANPAPTVTEGNPADARRIDTWRYDAGEGESVPWYLVWTYTDNGVETTPKQLSQIRPKGKFTDAKVQIYTVSPNSDIDTDDLDTGANPYLEFNVADSTMVKQHKIYKRRVRNALMWTARVEGTWDGTGMKDQFHELAIQVNVTGQER